MIEFKQIPYIIRKEENDVESRPEIHYTVEMRWAVIGEVESDIDPGDGTVRWSLKDNPVESSWNFDRKVVDWNNVKTIHFDKSCTVPRFKLGKFCTENRIKVIRDAEKADIIVYSEKYTKYIVDTDHSYIMYKSEVIRKINKTSINRNLISEILPFIEKSDSEYVIFDNEYEEITKKAKMIVNWGSYLYIQDYDKYQIFISPDCKYIHQDTILKNMGLDTIDETRFRKLCEMFDSTDTGNHVVAMEIMTNSDYESSIVYLLELMRRYYHSEIYNQHIRDGVSFKALREYLKYELKYYQRSFNDIIENVTDKNLLTEYNYKLILSLIMEEEEKRMGKEDKDDEDTDNWRITSVDLSPKFKNKIIWDKKEEPELDLVIDQPNFTA